LPSSARRCIAQSHENAPSSSRRSGFFGRARIRAAQTAPVPPARIADDVQAQSLRAMVDRLVSFGTRHTLSSQTDPKRGIGASLRWTEAEFRRYSRACGGCLTIATPSDTVTGRRIPTPTLVKNVFASSAAPPSRTAW
jgi:hypothetical protein